MTPDVEPDPKVGDGPQPLPSEEEVRKSWQDEPPMTREPGRDHTLIDGDKR